MTIDKSHIPEVESFELTKQPHVTKRDGGSKYIENFDIGVTGLGEAFDENFLMVGTGRRPTLKPEYSQLAIQTMARGYTKTAFAGFICVSLNTLVEWEIASDEFHRAILIGETLRSRFMQTGLIDAPTGPVVISRMFALKGSGSISAAEFREDSNTKYDNEGNEVKGIGQSASNINLNINFTKAGKLIEHDDD